MKYLKFNDIWNTILKIDNIIRCCLDIENKDILIKTNEWERRLTYKKYKLIISDYKNIIAFLGIRDAIIINPNEDIENDELSGALSIIKNKEKKGA